MNSKLSLEDFVNERKKTSTKKYISIYGLPVYHLKKIIENYNEKVIENKQIKKYKTMNKESLEKIIFSKIGDITGYYDAKYKNPYSNVDILKKAGINQYTDENQKEYLQSLSKNDRYSNPLQALTPYTNKEGKIEYLTPQEHQSKFILQFIYSTLRGAVVFHGVGSGKTLTAVISSYYYLKVNPNNKVIVISPSSLLFNFVAGMKQYGLDINDNRYSFFTYEKFIRNPKSGLNALVIIDEAHNFRTELITHELKDPSNPRAVIGKEASSNKRLFKIKEYATQHCDKILLLTGTAFVNKIYDIENLLALIDNREPVPQSKYEEILGTVSSILDYFNYRISYYVSDESNKEKYFPKRKEIFVPIYMTEEQEKQYTKIKNEGIPFSNSEKVNSFYSAEKYASNMIGGIDNPKVKYILDTIKSRKDEKFIVYSGLYDAGIKSLIKVLEKENIKFRLITGRQKTTQKEESKLLYNFYNFNNPKFFSNLTPQLQQYVNNEYRVLLISRAGAEGVDTINTNNIILMDNVWNEALSEQIIARAIRFQSHLGLPNKNYVNVIRMAYCYKRNENIVKKIQSNTSFVFMLKQIKINIKAQLDDVKKKGKFYTPTIKELKELKTKDGKLFIPEKSVYSKQMNVRGRVIPSKIIVKGWDDYKTLKKPEDRKVWMRDVYYKWYSSSNDVDEHIEDVIAIDLYLLILARSKQETIDGFIGYFGNSIKLFESYESQLLKLITEQQKKQKKPLSEEQKILIYNQLKTKQAENFKAHLEVKKSIYTEKYKRTTQQVLQQYFTNSKLSNLLVEISKIKNDKRENINILEPTAGAGDLIRPILLSKINAKISLVEFDPVNRDILKNLSNEYSTMMELKEQPDFLLYNDSKRYDYIFMNPPFHLRKSENYNLIQDVWDYDFIMKAFTLLKVGSRLYAITGLKFLSSEKSHPELITFNKFIQNKNILKFKYEIIKKQKFSEITIDIAIMIIEKINDSEDNNIMSIKYYKNQNDVGKQIVDNTLSIKSVFNKSLTKPDLMKLDKEYSKNHNDDMKELENNYNDIYSNKVLL